VARPTQKKKKSPRASRVKSGIRALWLAACLLVVVTPGSFAEITLVSRLSDANAFAQTANGVDEPWPRTQVDFLPASLVNRAFFTGEAGQAGADCTGNSSIVVDNSIGTLRVVGDGTAGATATLQGAFGSTTAKVIVVDFTLTDRTYTYLLTGELSANQFAGFSTPAATAKLAKGNATIFEVVAELPPAVTLSETGTLPPGNYTLSIEVRAAVHGGYGSTSLCNSSANFNFALGPVLTPTPTPTSTPGPTVTPTPSPAPPAQAMNLSTRMLVQTGDNVGIGGFIIAGSAPKRVLVRAVGPTLSQFGVPNPLADPVLELHGPPGFATIINDNCVPPQIIGPPPLCQPGSLDAIIDATLDPGAYTAVVRGNNNTSGVALVEVYDLNQSVDSKLANISTRAFVGTGGNIVIAGFILGGNSGHTRIAVRGIGPSLIGFGVPNPLADPTLELRDNNGALLRANNDWQDNAAPPGPDPQLIAAGLAPTNNLESGFVVTLPPGPYTALLAGVNNGTGLGLIEVYDLGSP
jgi:hypothetical protein